VLFKIATDLRVARAFEISLSFALTETETIFRGTLLVELALSLLAGFAKIHNVSHASGLGTYENTRLMRTPDPEVVSLRKMRR
jgi:hypothetical protein